MKQTTRSARAIADELVSVIDIHAARGPPHAGAARAERHRRVRFRLAEPLAVDPYAENRAAGAFILIDEATNDTVGAGMIASASS